MAESNFRFAGHALLLVDYIEGARFGVQLWMPPRGIWGAVTPRHEHPTTESAMDHALGFVDGGRGLLLYSPDDVFRRRGK